MMMTWNARRASNGRTAAVSSHVLSQNARTWVDTAEAHVPVTTYQRCPAVVRCPPANAQKNPVLNGNAVRYPSSMLPVPTIKPAGRSANGVTMANVPGSLRSVATNVRRPTSFVGDCVKAVMCPTGVSDLKCVANVHKRGAKPMNSAVNLVIVSMSVAAVTGAERVAMAAMKSIAKNQSPALI